MNFDLLTVNNPGLLPILIGALYLLSIILTKQLSIPKMILSAFTLLTLAPLDTVTYSFILAAYCLTLALMFMNEHKKYTAIKYFMAAFLLATINIDVLLPHYKFLFFICAICFAFFISEKNEINKAYVYVSNLTILVGLVARIGNIQSKELIATILLISLILVSLRMILGGISTLLYLLPTLLVASVLSDKMILLSVFIYALFISLLANSKKQQLALILISLLAFIDGSIFNRLLLTVINTSTTFDPNYMNWILATLLSVCTAKWLELEIKKGNIKFNFKTILATVIPVLILSVKIIQQEEFMVTLPVPIMLAVPLIFLEAKYVAIFSKISFNLKLNINKKLISMLRCCVIFPNKIRFKKLKNTMSKVAGYIDLETRTENHTILLVGAILAVVALIIIYGELL